jgi:hypothetical protein
MSTSSRHRRLRLLGAALIAVAIAIALPALAGAKDRNHDNLPDRWERNHDLSGAPRSGTPRPGPRRPGEPR